MIVSNALICQAINENLVNRLQATKSAKITLCKQCDRIAHFCGYEPHADAPIFGNSENKFSAPRPFEFVIVGFLAPSKSSSTNTSWKQCKSEETIFVGNFALVGRLTVKANHARLTFWLTKYSISTLNEAQLTLRIKKFQNTKNKGQKQNRLMQIILFLYAFQKFRQVFTKRRRDEREKWSN